MTEHLTDLDVVRVLSFDPEDEATRALEKHAAACPKCRSRLEQEAALEMTLIDCAELREPPAALVRLSVAASAHCFHASKRDGRIRRRWREPIGGVLVVAMAAAVLLGIAHSRKRAVESITPAFTDLAVEGVAPNAADPWVLIGSNPARYTKSVERDRSVASRSVRSLRRADGPNAEGFGSIAQMFAASKYAGKRVRFSADVRVSNVDRWAGLWMRADTDQGSVAFDNMADRPIKATTSWERFSVVLDIPKEATNLAVGLLLDGSGAAFFADPRVEIVGRDVPVTKTADAPALAPDFTP